jgi:UDP:flavonoid glycosyltransferase YjiC (YdhE family)
MKIYFFWTLQQEVIEYCPMKILYGVQSDGMGHALRSYAVMEYLMAQGHTVKVVTSGRALDFFRKHNIDAQEVE